MSTLTKITADIKSANDSLATPNLALLGKHADKTAQAFQDTLADWKENKVTLDMLPEAFNQAHPTCLFIYTALASGVAKSAGGDDLLLLSKKDRKGFSVEREARFSAGKRRFTRLYPTLRISYAGKLNGVPKAGANPKGHTPYSPDQRLVLGLDYLQGLFSPEKEPTAHQVAVASFLTKTIDTLLSDYGTDEMRQAHDAHMKKKLKASVGISKIKAKA